MVFSSPGVQEKLSESDSEEELSGGVATFTLIYTTAAPRGADRLTDGSDCWAGSHTGAPQGPLLPSPHLRHS